MAFMLIVPMAAYNVKKASESVLFSPTLLINDEQNTQQKPLVRRGRDEVLKGTLEAELHQDWFLSALVLLLSLFVRTPFWPESLCYRCIPHRMIVALIADSQ
jgi:hypothetical protein